MKAFVFPGQGAQFVGMGKELYDNSPLAKELFDKANDILGYRITDIMFNGTDEELKQTKVTQPAVFLHSVISALCMGGAFKPSMVAGHSLGEFSALVAAGALSFEDGLRLVYARAMAMQKACDVAPGTMAAIIGLSDEKVEEKAKAEVEGAKAKAEDAAASMENTQEEDDPLKQDFSEKEEAEFRNAMLDALPDGSIVQVAINYLDKYPAISSYIERTHLNYEVAVDLSTRQFEMIPELAINNHNEKLSIKLPMKLDAEKWEIYIIFGKKKLMNIFQNLLLKMKFY